MLDPTFTTEIAIIRHLTGPEANERLVSAIMESLPSACVQKDPAEIIQHLQALKSDPIYTFASDTTQSHLRMTVKLLNRVIEELPLEVLQLQNDDNMRNIIHRFGCFIRVKQDSDGSEQTVLGAPALREMYLIAKAAHDVGTCTLPMVAPLRTYEYLVPTAYRKQAKQLHERVNSGSTVPMTKRRKTCKTSVQNDNEKAVTEALSMFS